MEELIGKFDLSGITKSNSKFDFEKCKWVNAEHLKQLSPAALLEASRPFLEKAGLPVDDDRIPAALELARDRVQLLSEIPAIIETIFVDLPTYDPSSVEKVKSREGAAEAVSALREGLEQVEDWSDDAIKAGIVAGAESLGVKMGALMLPCRVGVMGSTSGADLVPVLSLLGKEVVLRRLSGFSEML